MILIAAGDSEVGIYRRVAQKHSCKDKKNEQLEDFLDTIKTSEWP